MTKVKINDEQKIVASNEDFSLASLRMKQNFGDLAGAKKLLNTVPVRKPHKQTFVRVSPNPDNVIKTMLLELDNETYLVAQDLWADLSEELVPKALFLTITRQKVLQLWPVRLPSDDARTDVWSISSIQAVEAAQNRWVRVRSNMDLGAYEVIEATGPSLSRTGRIHHLRRLYVSHSKGVTSLHLTIRQSASLRGKYNVARRSSLQGGLVPRF